MHKISYVKEKDLRYSYKIYLKTMKYSYLFLGISTYKKTIPRSRCNYFNFKLVIKIKILQSICSQSKKTRQQIFATSRKLQVLLRPQGVYLPAFKTKIHTNLIRCP